MKTAIKLRSIAAALLASSLIAGAADKKIEAGPRGGRILGNTIPKAELFLETNHTATITFYDSALKPVAVADQSAVVIAEAKDAKSRIEFEKKGEVLASKTRLPEGSGYNVVVQLKQTADAKPQNFRFKLDTHNCGGCKRAEYACTCDH